MMFRNGRSSCFKVIIQCICKRYGGDMEKFETRVLHCSKVDVLLLYCTLLKHILDRRSILLVTFIYGVGVCNFQSRIKLNNT